MTNAEHIRQSLYTLRDTGDPNIKSLIPQLSSELLLRGARRAMSERLDFTVKLLPGDWWCERDVEIGDIAKALSDQCQTRTHAPIDVRDILNLAAMLYIRQACDTPESLPENNGELPT